MPFFEISNARKHTITFNWPETLEFTDGMTPDDVFIRLVLESVPRDTVTVSPPAQDICLPTLLVPGEPPDGFTGTPSVRCRCTFRNVTAAFFPDVRAHLHNLSAAESLLQGSFEKDFPVLANRPTVTEKLTAAAESVRLETGMILPCEAIGTGGVTFGVCVLVDDLGDSRFLCELSFVKPVAIHAGVALTRNVNYNVVRNPQEYTCRAEIAIVEEVLAPGYAQVE
ncbi:MAG: hypothetical protein JSS02_10655 [Planctomycetes bacterium]|nr:hypothetical protein [Planctomycetota bacterium]